MTRQKVGNDSNFCGELGNAENGLLIPIPLYFLKCLSRASSLAGKLADWFFRADRIPIKEITGKAKNIALIERSRNNTLRTRCYHTFKIGLTPAKAGVQKPWKWP